VAGRRSIHVVAGLLIKDNEVCITRRRADVHQGGKWEFPGGKLEPHEDPLSGLKRELHEELGIEIQHALPFVQVRHAYPDLDVLLDVWRVTGYARAPHGREFQEMRWADIQRLDPQDFPDADRPVLRRLQLPRLYALSDVRRFGEEEFAQRLLSVLAAGARLIQLREPHMDRASFCAYARRLSALCHRFDARLIINADPSWLRECEADGVHLNSRRLMQLKERPCSEDHWVAASCHDTVELNKAQALQADFAVLGPVRRTASHPDSPVLGWSRFEELQSPLALPVYAIGGMRAADLSQALSCGAQGLAMISGLWDADDPRRVAAELSKA
jgi:8-oxo-dGTP diphosphatase